MSLFKTEWRKLIFANYRVDCDILESYLPYQTVLDRLDGNCYISVVSFMFRNTRMAGVRLPLLANFEQVNFRFYVKHKTPNGYRHGVVFLKELVEKPVITFLSNIFLKENYETVPMTHQHGSSDGNLHIDHGWAYGKKGQFIRVTAGNEPTGPSHHAQYFCERHWGYTEMNEKKTFELEVLHPKWQAYEVKDWDVRIDFGATCGSDFRFLNQLQPESVMLFEGSPVSFGQKNIIKSPVLSSDSPQPGSVVW